MRIEGKTALVTGGTAGIGEQLALQLAAKGAKVIVTGRSEERLASMRERGFEAIHADLSNPAGVDALVAALDERDFDILVNNAGQGVDHDFREAAPDMGDTDDCIHANLNAPIRLTTALVPQMAGLERATIVNVTSGLAIAPRAGSPVYCATKSGLRSYTQAIRAQLNDMGIHVIEALPPVVDTQMTAGRGGHKMSAEDCAAAIVHAIEKDRDEANIGMVKILKRVHSISPALARNIMLRF
ncbi:SDR family NAD(P)-dependent oxidoreductase [Qipengyuania sp. 1NDH17]|uniref:SDR family NAD(P)-dependent oxidoreductase n=1 Tax=Qipengyuania polymorpha TaxID=2867234 RepID=A0ABS7IW44_9SPHN|nr:SDR family NAD(P)-dependent oxidoreductase [Qipengyuania polymorpha]MBX7457728.1 SDR family NAD(P)-dependent oxidoreductase [Qipengyuania polymorpha]